MKLFKILFDTVKAVAFWGLFGLIIIVFLFGVDIRSIWNEAVSGIGNIRTVSVFLIFSGGVFSFLQLSVLL